MHFIYLNQFDPVECNINAKTKLKTHIQLNSNL